MSTIREVDNLPDYGMALFFYPDGATSFKAQLNWCPPPDITEDQENFYAALAHGLLSVAVSETKDVCQHGANVIQSMAHEVENSKPDETIDAVFGNQQELNLVDTPSSTTLPVE